MLGHSICFFFWYIFAIICFILFIYLFLLMLILDFKILLTLCIHTEIPRPHFSRTVIAIINFRLKLLEAVNFPLSWNVTIYHMYYIHGHTSSFRLIGCNVEVNHTFDIINCCFSSDDAIICTVLRTCAAGFLVLSSRESLFVVYVVHIPLAW